jgi:endoglucanase
MKIINRSLILVALMSLSAMAEVHIRYNMFGYSPSRQKRIVVMSDTDVEKNGYNLVNITTGDTLISSQLDGSVYGKGDHLPLDFNYVIDFSNITNEGEYQFSIEGKKSVLFSIKKDPYKKIVEGPIHWMRVARCGSEDAEDHGLCHLGDSSSIVHHRKGIDNGSWHDDGNGKRIDGTGGWHDAADYLKFSLTIAYADYFLLRSYEIYPELFDGIKNHSKTKYNDMLDECKWGLDFLMKCMPDEDEFIVMVANSEDHNVGYRLPEDDELDGKRPVLSALSPVQMGYTSAALALGARIFHGQGDVELAKKYGDMAKAVFRRATSKDVVANAWLNDEVNAFYGDETKNDNLELAAAELYKWSRVEAGVSVSPQNDTAEGFTASEEMTLYLAEAIKYGDLARSAGWRAWESVNMPAHITLMEYYPIAKNDLYKDLDAFLANSRRQGNVWGVPMKYVWGGLYSYIGVGAAALEFEVKSGERKYAKLGREMLDYLLGYNNWGISFVASKKFENSIRQPYSQVYNLQADKFPVGAISEGPGDRGSWEHFEHYFGFDTNAERTNPFNTKAGVFYDNRKDFMCMETTIAGVADGIFMLTVAAKYFQE